MVAFILSFLLLSTFPGPSPTIEGKNREYAGKRLEFFRVVDPVTQEKTLLFTLEMDHEGSFKTKIDISRSTYAFCDFGIYRGQLFLEEGESLRLLLPPLREKSFADRKNPYFQPVEFWFATEKGDRLTDRVAAFDTRLNQLTDSFFNALYIRQSKAAFDTICHQLNKTFEAHSSDALALHKKLKIKYIKAEAFRLPIEKVSDAFQSVNPAFRTHPAFLQLFDKTFTNALSFEAQAETGDRIERAVASGDVNFLIRFINEKYRLTGAPAALSLLKMLHDGYYSGDFSQDDILQLIASSYFSNNPDSRIREIAVNIQKKLMHLRQGTKAPEICLKNTDGHRVCSQEASSGQTGKFKYLIFADTEMIVCREQLKYLTRIAEQFHKHLDIIIVLKKTDLIEMKMFLEKQQIPGMHLIDEHGEFIEKYRIKSFPECFLLNDQHEVVFQQTRAPLDGFEQQFSVFLRQELFERQRN